MTNFQHTSKNRKFFTLVGTIGLLGVTAVIVLYRGTLLGASSPDFLSKEAAIEVDAEAKSFATEVEYSEPFRSSESNNSSVTSSNVAAAASGETGFLDFFKTLFTETLFGDEQNYRPVVPIYTTIESLTDTRTIAATPETLISEADDRRSLGYTGQRKIVVDAEGNIAIAYRRSYQKYQQIFVSELQKVKGGFVLATPTQPLSVRMLGITQRVPAMTIDEKESLQVVWYGSDNEEYPDRRQVNHVQSKSSKSSWRQNDLVSYVEGYSSDHDLWQEHPSITLGEYDDLYVAWEGKDEENEKPQVKFSRSFDGGREWSDWENVHPSTQFTYSRPTIVYTPDKALHIFAYSSNKVTSGTNQIQYSYSTDLGATWSDWEIVSNGQFDARHISATVVNGNPVIAYRAQLRTDGPTQIVTQIVTPQQSSVPRVVHATENYQFFPSITAITDTNSICVTWIEENTSSDFPNEDPTDGDIFFGCQTLEGTAQGVFNLTPEGSHLYPVLPATATAEYLPIAYYDDDQEQIILRLLSLEQQQ